MNKATYRKNYAHLVRETTKMLKAYGEAALKSKAFDLEAETTEFSLPKNVIYAGLMHCQHQWVPKGIKDDPRGKTIKKEIENIYTMTYP